MTRNHYCGQGQPTPIPEHALSFHEFIREREAIRLGKITDDPALLHYHFTNVCRDSDAGTKLLADKSHRDIVSYRWHGSPRNFFDTDYNGKISNTAYQTPRCNKGQKIAHVVQNLTGGNLADTLWRMANKRMSIIEATHLFADETRYWNGNRFWYLFHNSEIAKDFASRDTGVDPNSECLVNIGAIYGVRCIEKGVAPLDRMTTKKGIELYNAHPELAPIVRSYIFDDWRFQDIEHALCEYGKYCRITTHGVGRKRRKK